MDKHQQQQQHSKEGALASSASSSASMGLPVHHAPQASTLLLSRPALTDTPPSCAFQECLAAISRSGPRVAVREGSHTAGAGLGEHTSSSGKLPCGQWMPPCTDALLHTLEHHCKAPRRRPNKHSTHNLAAYPPAMVPSALAVSSMSGPPGVSLARGSMAVTALPCAPLRAWQGQRSEGRFEARCQAKERLQWLWPRCRARRCGYGKGKSRQDDVYESSDIEYLGETRQDRTRTGAFKKEQRSPELGIHGHGVRADEEGGTARCAHCHHRQQLRLQGMPKTRCGRVCTCTAALNHNSTLPLWSSLRLPHCCALGAWRRS